MVRLLFRVVRFMPSRFRNAIRRSGPAQFQLTQTGKIQVAAPVALVTGSNRATGLTYVKVLVNNTGANGLSAALVAGMAGDPKTLEKIFAAYCRVESRMFCQSTMARKALQG